MSDASTMITPPAVPEPLRPAPRIEWNTAAGWLLALFPVAAWFLSNAALSYLEDGTAESVLLAVLLLVLSAVLPLVLAILDSRRLSKTGHPRVPHPAWALLGPLVYLVVRTVHLNRSVRRGSAPLWYCTAISVVTGIIGAMTAIAPAAAGAQAALSVTPPAREEAPASAEELAALYGPPVTDVEDVRAAIEDEVWSEEPQYAVSCPEDASVAPGEVFQCTVTAPDGDIPFYVQVEMLKDEPGYFSYAALTP